MTSAMFFWAALCISSDPSCAPTPTHPHGHTRTHKDTHGHRQTDRQTHSASYAHPPYCPQHTHRTVPCTPTE
eukprot:1166365-Rhodomonas_salina.1